MILSLAVVTLPALPPCLTGRDVSLRGLQPADAAALFACRSHPEVLEHTSLDEPTPDLVGHHITRVRHAYEQRTSCQLAITLREDQGLIGTCGFTDWSLTHEWAELAYDLARPYWGRGLASQAVGAALRWAFEDVGFRRVHAVVMTTNERSVRLLERAGFVREGTLRQFRICRGTPRDFWFYSLLVAEWRAGGGGAHATMREMRIGERHH